MITPILKPKERGRNYGKRLPAENGVIYYPDGREVCTTAGWQKRKREMWGAWISAGIYPRCHLCKRLIQDFSEFSPDHVITRGLGGAKRNDSLSNLRPSHVWCNLERGSKKL